MLETFKATVTSIERLQVKAEARGFEIIMDEPPELGGDDTGMNPVEAILCSLGSCLSIVVAAFAKAKKFKYQDLRIELEGDLDPDGFMGLAEDVRNGFQEIRYTFHIKTDEPEEKVKEFLRFVEDSCPVCDILKNQVPVIRAGIVTD